MPRSIGFTQFEFERYGGQVWDRVTLRKFHNGHTEGCVTRYKTLSELPPFASDVPFSWPERSSS